MRIERWTLGVSIWCSSYWANMACDSQGIFNCLKFMHAPLDFLDFDDLVRIKWLQLEKWSFKFQTCKHWTSEFKNARPENCYQLSKLHIRCFQSVSSIIPDRPTASWTVQILVDGPNKIILTFEGFSPGQNTVTKLSQQTRTIGLTSFSVFWWIPNGTGTEDVFFLLCFVLLVRNIIVWLLTWYTHEHWFQRSAQTEPRREFCCYETYNYFKQLSRAWLDHFGKKIFVGERGGGRFFRHEFLLNELDSITLNYLTVIECVNRQTLRFCLK